MTKSALSAYYILAPAEASSNLAKYDGVRYGTPYANHSAEQQAQESYVYAKTRGEGFGPEVKRRIMLGAFTLSAQAIDNYFIQAQRIRRLVQHDFNTAFAAEHPLAAHTPATEQQNRQGGVDVIICPTAPSSPPTIPNVANAKEAKSPLDAYINDVFTVPASLAGLPAISVPVSGVGSGSIQKSEDLAGIQVIGQYGDDGLVLKVGKLLEEKGS